MHGAHDSASDEHVLTEILRLVASSIAVIQAILQVGVQSTYSTTNYACLCQEHVVYGRCSIQNHETIHHKQM